MASLKKEADAYIAMMHPGASEAEQESTRYAFYTGAAAALSLEHHDAMTEIKVWNRMLKMRIAAQENFVRRFMGIGGHA